MANETFVSSNHGTNFGTLWIENMVISIEMIKLKNPLCISVEKKLYTFHSMNFDVLCLHQNMKEIEKYKQYSLQ